MAHEAGPSRRGSRDDFEVVRRGDVSVGKENGRWKMWTTREASRSGTWRSGAVAFEPIPPVMKELFQGFLGILEQEGLLDSGGEHAERQGRDHGNGAEPDGTLMSVEILEVGESPGGVEKAVVSVATCLAQQDVIGFVLGEDIEDDLGAPLDLSGGLGLAEIISIHHETGLGGVPEVMLQQVRAPERLVQVLEELLGREKVLEPGWIQRLLGIETQHKPVIVGGGDGIASDAVGQPEGDDAREGIVGGAADEGVKEIMASGVGVGGCGGRGLRRRRRGGWAFGRAARKHDGGHDELRGMGGYGGIGGVLGSRSFGGTWGGNDRGEGIEEGGIRDEQLLDEEEISGGDFADALLHGVDAVDDGGVVLAAVEAGGDPRAEIRGGIR